MALEWTLTAGVGLMVGIAFGILVELRYVVLMDRKIERLLEKVERIELKMQKELEKTLKKKTTRRKRK